MTWNTSDKSGLVPSAQFPRARVPNLRTSPQALCASFPLALNSRKLSHSALRAATSPLCGARKMLRGPHPSALRATFPGGEGISSSCWRGRRGEGRKQPLRPPEGRTPPLAQGRWIRGLASSAAGSGGALSRLAAIAVPGPVSRRPANGAAAEKACRLHLPQAAAARFSPCAGKAIWKGTLIRHPPCGRWRMPPSPEGKAIWKGEWK